MNTVLRLIDHITLPKAVLVIGIMLFLGLSSTLVGHVGPTVLVASVVGVPHLATTGENQTSIRPFQIQVSDEALNDLRRRLLATRWPDKETVPDRSQGIQLEKLQSLVHYWAEGYDWRKIEAKLNALPQFMTNIDGVDIHFIHVRSRHNNALPVVITHGWPGSVIEQLKIIAPLTDPTAHGGNAEDAFDVVIPSLPGFGFSGRPTGTGWEPDRIARTWAELMKRLGYTHYVAQGGDWGTPVSSAMARQAVAGLRAESTLTYRRRCRMRSRWRSVAAQRQPGSASRNAPCSRFSSPPPREGTQRTSRC